MLLLLLLLLLPLLLFFIPIAAGLKQEVAAAETPLAHTLWACRPPPAGTLAHCPADTSLYWVLAKMMAARETNSAPIHSSNTVQNLIKVQSQDVFRCTKV